MGKKHDEIVFSFTKEKIMRLLAKKLYGEQGCWSRFHDICKNDSKDIDPKRMDIIFQELAIIKGISPWEAQKISWESLKNLCERDRVEINETPFKDSLEIKKQIEVPIIKGNGEFRVTKGFLDIVLSIDPRTRGFFSCYANRVGKTAVIEVKKLEDFEDIGKIIRQLNKYKEYAPFGRFGSRGAEWFVYCDVPIPEMAKQMLEESGYIVLQDPPQPEPAKEVSP